MTVKELIEYLLKLPSSAEEVYVCTDECPVLLPLLRVTYNPEDDTVELYGE